MNTRHAWIAVAAAGAFGLAACETNSYAPASVDTAAAPPPATSPYTPGSTTGTPPGSDSNLQGAGSAGTAPAPPAAPSP
jgi:hypothetical protein